MTERGSRISGVSNTSLATSSLSLHYYVLVVPVQKGSTKVPPPSWFSLPSPFSFLVIYQWDHKVPSSLFLLVIPFIT